MPENKPRYSLTVGGKQRTVEADKFNENIDAFVSEMPDATVRMKREDGTEKDVKLNDLSQAYDEGYDYVTTDKPIYVNTKAPEAETKPEASGDGSEGDGSNSADSSDRPIGYNGQESQKPEAKEKDDQPGFFSRMFARAERQQPSENAFTGGLPGYTGFVQMGASPVPSEGGGRERSDSSDSRDRHNRPIGQNRQNGGWREQPITVGYLTKGQRETTQGEVADSMYKDLESYYNGLKEGDRQPSGIRYLRDKAWNYNIDEGDDTGEDVNYVTDAEGKTEAEGTIGMGRTNSLVNNVFSQFLTDKAKGVADEIASKLSKGQTADEAMETLKESYYQDGVQRELWDIAAKSGIERGQFIEQYVKPAIDEAVKRTHNGLELPVGQLMSDWNQTSATSKEYDPAALNDDERRLYGALMSEFDKKLEEIEGKGAEASRRVMEGATEQTRMPGNTGAMSLGAGLMAERERNSIADPSVAIDHVLGKLWNNGGRSNGGRSNGDKSDIDRGAVGQLLYRKIMDKLVASRMPKSKWGYVLSGFADSDIGTAIQNYLKTDFERHLDNVANSKYAQSLEGFTGMLTSGGHEATRFVADAWEYYLGGKVGSAVTGAMRRKAVKELAQDLAARNIRPKVARGIAERVFSKTERGLVEKAVMGGVHGAATMGVASGISGAIGQQLSAASGEKKAEIEERRASGETISKEEEEREIADAERDARSIVSTAGAAAQGLLGGAMAGLAFGPGTVAGDVVSKWGSKYMGDVASAATGYLARLGTNATAATAMGQVEGALTGQQPEGSIGNQLAQNLVTFAMLDAQNMAPRLLNGHPIRDYRDWKEQQRRYNISDGDQERMRAAGYGDLIDTIVGASPDRSKGTAFPDPKAERELAVDSRERRERARRDVSTVNEGMLRLLSDARLPEELKRKYYALITGDESKKLSPVVASEVTEDEDGNHYLVTYNKDGGVVSDRQYHSEKAAQEDQQKIGHEQDENLTDALQDAVFAKDADGVMEEAYNAAAEAYRSGQEIDERSRGLLYLYQNRERLVNALRAMGTGEPLSEADERLVNMFTAVRSYLYTHDSTIGDIRTEAESVSGLGSNSLAKARKGHTKKEAERMAKERGEETVHVGGDVWRTEGEDALVKDYQRRLYDYLNGIEEGGWSESPNSRGRHNGPNRLIGQGGEEEAGDGPSGEPTAVVRRHLSGHERGMGVEQDETQVAQIRYDREAAQDRFDRAFQNGQLRQFADGLRKAVEDDDEEAMQKQLDAWDAWLSDEQREAALGLIESAAAEAGVEDSVIAQSMAYQDQRKAELAAISDSNGMITELKLRDGSTVWLKSGDLSNEYGGVIVVDEGGNTRQIPVGSITNVGEPVRASEQLEKDVDAFGNALEQSYEGIANGSVMMPGQKATISISGQLFNVTMERELEDGREQLRLEDGSAIVLSPDELGQAAAEARATQIATAAAASEAARQQAAEQARLEKGIVGYKEGTPDYSHKDTDAKVAGAWLRQQDTAAGKKPQERLSTIQAEMERLKALERRKEQDAERERGWMEANGDDWSEGERADKEREIAQMEQEAADLRQRQRKWGSVRNSYMTEEERSGMEAERSRSMEQARKRAEQRISKNATKETGFEGKVPSNEELLSRFGTQQEADNYLTEERQRVASEYRNGAERTISRVRQAMDDYMHGLSELDADEQTGLMEELLGAEATERAMTGYMKELKAQQKKLGTLYKKRNEEALKKLSLSERRAAILAKAKDGKSLLNRAHEAYSGSAMESRLDELEPETVEELVAQILPAHSLSYEGKEVGGKTRGGLKQELGMSRGIGRGYDTSTINHYVAAKGAGDTIDEAAHKIWENRPEQMAEVSDIEIKEALLNLLSSAQSPRDISELTLRNRIAEVEAYERGEEEQAEWYRRQEEEEQRKRQADIDDYNAYLEATAKDMVPAAEVEYYLNGLYADEIAARGEEEALVKESFLEELRREGEEEGERNSADRHDRPIGQDINDINNDGHREQEADGGSQRVDKEPEQRGADAGSGESETPMRGEGADKSEAKAQHTGQEGPEPERAAMAAGDRGADGGLSVQEKGERSKGVRSNSSDRLNGHNRLNRGKVDFSKETEEEYAAFEQRIPTMSDEELLGYIAQDDPDVTKSAHPNLGDTYDLRHEAEEDEARELYESATEGMSREELEDMEASVWREWKDGGYATPERVRLGAQLEVVQDRLQELEDESLPQPLQGRGVSSNGSNSIGATSTTEHVESERLSVNTEPTDGQKEAGNYKKGHIKIDGYDITIENPKGSTRSGHDANGKEWSIKMNYDYGYIKGTEGVDGDHIDVYLSDNPTSGNVYVVDQIDQKTGKFDEHKVMYGFPSMKAAIDAYKSQYEKGWKVGTVTEVSREDFKKWVESSHRKTKPFNEYKSVEAIGKQNGGRFDSQDRFIRQGGEEPQPKEEVLGITIPEDLRNVFSKDMAQTLADDRKNKVLSGIIIDPSLYGNWALLEKGRDDADARLAALREKADKSANDYVEYYSQLGERQAYEEAISRYFGGKRLEQGNGNQSEQKEEQPKQEQKESKWMQDRLQELEDGRDSEDRPNRLNGANGSNQGDGGEPHSKLNIMFKDAGKAFLASGLRRYIKALQGLHTNDGKITRGRGKLPYHPFFAIFDANLDEEAKPFAYVDSPEKVLVKMLDYDIPSVDLIYYNPKTHTVNFDTLHLDLSEGSYDENSNLKESVKAALTDRVKALVPEGQNRPNRLNGQVVRERRPVTEQAEPKYYTVNIGKNGRKQYVVHGYNTARIISKKEWDEAVSGGAAHSSDDYIKALDDEQFWHTDFPRKNGGIVPVDLDVIDKAIAEAENAGLGDMPHTRDLRRLRELTANRDQHQAALQKGMSDEDAYWNQYYDEDGNRRDAKNDGLNRHNRPVGRDEALRKASEQRRAKILSEGTGFDDTFGLTKPGEIKDVAELSANVDKIISGLSRNEGKPSVRDFEGFAYNGKYSDNAAHQVYEYLISLSGVSKDLSKIGKDFVTVNKIETWDALTDYVKRKYEASPGPKAELENKRQTLKTGDDVLSEVERRDSFITDQQGNPVDSDGKLIKAKVSSIDDITDEDFTNPTRTVELPALPKNVDKAIGTSGKPVIIKKNIFEKNRKAHGELSGADNRHILSKTLYTPYMTGQSQPIKHPHYWVAIEDKRGKSVTVVEVNNNKDNVEVVGWHKLDSEGLERLKKQAKREGGQFLIQTVDTAAAALSTLPSGSEGKGSENIPSEQGILDKISEYDSASKAYFDNVVGSGSDSGAVGERYGKAEKALKDAFRKISAGRLYRLNDGREHADWYDKLSYSARGLLTDVVREKEQRAREESDYERAVEAGRGVAPKKPLTKVSASDFAVKDKKDGRAAMKGVYHDSGYIVGTDGHALYAEKASYPKELEGKVTDKDGGEVPGIFPRWRSVVPDMSESEPLPMPVDSLHSFVSGVPKSKDSFVAFRTSNGDITAYRAKDLDMFLRAAKKSGGDVRVIAFEENAYELGFSSDKGIGLLMPVLMENARGRAFGYEVNRSEGVSDGHIGHNRPDGRDAASAVIDEAEKRKEIASHATLNADELRKREPAELRTLERKELGQADTDEQLAKIAKGAKKEKLLKNAEAHRANGELASRVRAEIEAERERLREQRTEELQRQLDDRERALRDELVDIARRAGMEVIDDVDEGRRVLDLANRRGLPVREGKKRALETASPDESGSLTVISSVHGTKVLQNLDNLVKECENSKTQPKIFVGSVAKALGIPPDAFKDKSSQYATFETKNDRIITIRISNHNVTTSNLDTNGQPDAISIVVTNKPNSGIVNDGFAHAVEYYYNSIKLRKAEGKPLADIVRSIKQALYSGEYKDITGLAERQEVNILADKVREMRGWHGSGRDFDMFQTMDHLGEGEGSQSFGAGTYVADQRGLGAKYAEIASRPLSVADIDGKEVEWRDLPRESAERTAASLLYYHRSRSKALQICKDREEWHSVRGESEEAQRYKDAYRLINDGSVKLHEEGRRYLYEVEIPDDNGKNYLEWDGKPTEELKEAAYNKIVSRGSRLYREGAKGKPASAFQEKLRNNISKWSNGQLYDRMTTYLDGSQVAVSGWLNSLGYTGIKVHAAYNSGDTRYQQNWNYIVFNDADVKIRDKVRLFRSSNGEALGFTVGGKIYIDPRAATAETPLHEYTHLWVDAIKKLNPKEWKNIVELLKGTWVWERVKKLYPELKSDDEIADEALAHFSGRRGAENAREAMDEAGSLDGHNFEGSEGVRSEGVSDGHNGPNRLNGQDEASLRKAAREGLSRLKEALEKFWKNVCDLLHIHFTNAEEVADRVMADYLRGFDPRKVAESSDMLRDNRNKPHKKSIRIAEGYNGFSQKEFDEFKDKHLGKKIEDENIDKFLATIKQTSDIEPEMIPYSKESYNKLFGKGIDTPIGHVKMSEKQDEKMEDKKRTKYFSLAKPTLERPDFILARPSNAKEGQQTERPSSYIFVKTFRSADNSYVTYYNAVSVKKDGLEVVQSSYMPYENQVKGSIKGSTLIHLKSVALPSVSDTTVQGNQRTNPVGGSSSAKVAISDETSVTKSENVEERGDNRIREQRVDDSERTLMGVHNISLEKLLKAIRQGGLANPSMAVIDTRNGIHDKFGEISLIPSSGLIDKRGGRNAGTWTGDAYTPRYPQVELRMSAKGNRRLDKDMSALADKNETFRELWSDIRYNYGQMLEGRGDKVSNYSWFLADTGREIPKVMEELPYPKDVLRKLNAIAEKKGGKGTPFDSSLIYNLSPEELDEAIAVYADYASKHIVADGLTEKDYHIRKYEKAAEKAATAKARQIMLDKAAESRKYGDTRSLAVKRLEQMGHSAYRVDQPRQIDRTATYNASKKYVEANGLQKEYEAWKNGLVERYDEKEYFYTGTDNMGRPRYKENTLANASAWMKMEGRAGAEGAFAGFAGFAAKHMNTLSTTAQIRRNKGQLREGEEERKRLEGLYFDLMHMIDERVDTYDADAYVDEIADARDPIAFAKEEYGISLPREYAEKQAELLAGIKSMPTLYFETKFERPVYLNEFETAVVPDDTPLTVIDELERSGLKVEKYKAGDDESRKAVTMRAAEGSDDILFRLADEDEAAVLDEQPTVKVYRAMQVIDGKLYPPMMAAVKGELVEPRELGQWEVADERPEIITHTKTNKQGEEIGYVKLDKGSKTSLGKKGTPIPAAYNPYWHTSRSPLNDQFKSAWIRPNIVTVEVEVPVSELTSGYRAKYAKDSVGETDWHSGSVTKQLTAQGHEPRKVILSRYDKPVRVLSASETADRIVDFIRGYDVTIPENVVTPQVRVELEKRGVKIGAPEKGVRKTEQIREAIERGLSVDERVLRDAEVFEDGELIEVSEGEGGLRVDGLNRPYDNPLELLNAFRDKYPGYVATLVDESGQPVEVEDLMGWKHNGNYLYGYQSYGFKGLGRKKLFVEVEAFPGAKWGATPSPSKGGELKRQAYIERKTRNALETVRHWAEKLHLDNVEVVVDRPDGHNRLNRRERAKGWFDPKTEKIVINLRNHRDLSDVLRTLMHEGVAHYGLRKLFGEHFDTFLDNVWNNASADVRHRMELIMEKYRGSVGALGSVGVQRRAVEEYLAGLAEDTDFEHIPQTWWSKIKNFFLDMLTKAGIRLKQSLSDYDLRYILWRSYEHLKGDNKPAPAELAKRRELREKAEDEAEREDLMEAYKRLDEAESEYKKYIENDGEQRSPETGNGLRQKIRSWRSYVKELEEQTGYKRVESSVSLTPTLSEGEGAERREPKVETDYSKLPKKIAEIKASHGNPVVLVSTGNMYSAFGDDAKLVGRLFGTAIVTRREGDGKGMAMTTIPEESLDTIIPRLVGAGKRVAVAKEAGLFAGESDDDAIVFDGREGVRREGVSNGLNWHNVDGREGVRREGVSNGLNGHNRPNGHDGLLYRLGDEADSFEERQRRAVESRGTVMSGLNDAEVRVVDVPRHDFTGTGKEALKKAEEWAKEHIVGVHTAIDGTGQSFDYEIGNKSVEKFVSPSSTQKSENVGVHLSVLKKLPEVISNSIEAEEHPDYTKDADGKRNADNSVNSSSMIHRFYGAATIDGNVYRVKTTIREYADSNKNSRAHNYEVTKIELIEAPSTSGANASGEPLAMTSTNSISAAKLLKDVEKSYDKGKKLLDESAEVDEELERQKREMSDAAEAMSDALGGRGITITHDGRNGVKGSYDSGSDTVRINIDEAESVDDIEGTVLHEVVGHEGLKALFGSNEEVDKFGQFIYDSASKDLRRRIVERAEREGYEWTDPKRFSKAAQEVFADIAAEGPASADEFSLWRRVKHYIIRAMKRLGIRLRGVVNDHDLRYYTLKTGKAVKRWRGMSEAERQEAAESGRVMYSRGKPRQKRGESMSAYIKRLQDYEMWKQAEERARDANDPMPDRATYEAKAQEAYDAAMAEWRRENGIAEDDKEPGPVPQREAGESAQDYGIRVADWAAKQDKWRSTPDPFEYLRKAEEEYRRDYEAWKVRYDIHEMESVDEQLYGASPAPSEGGEMEHGVELDEEAAMRRAAIEHAVDEAVEREFGEAVGIDTSAEGAERHAKLAVIERRKNLESASAEDAIFIHDLGKDINTLAKEMSMKPEDLRWKLIHIIERPVAQKEAEAEVESWVEILNKMRALQDAHTTITVDGVKAASAELGELQRQYYKWGEKPTTQEGRRAVHDAAVKVAEKLNDYYMKASPDPNYNPLYGDDIMQVGRYVHKLAQALADANSADALAEDERVKKIVDMIHEWYDQFYHLIEDAGLRGNAGYIAEGYINHVWDKDKSDEGTWSKYVENWQRTRSGNMKKREVATYLDGISIGLVPKFDDVLQIMSYYSRQNNEAIANKKFLDDLSFMKVSETNKDGEVVRVLPLLVSHHPSRLDEDRYKMYHVPGVGDVWVLKEVSRRFASIFGTMRTQDIPGWLSKIGKSYDLAGSTMKKIQLSLSGFHAGALSEVALAQMRPDRGMKAIFKYILLDTIRNGGEIPAYAHPDDFRLAAKHLVQLGATQDYAAADVNMITEKFRNFVKGLRKDDNFMKQVGGGAMTPFAVALDWINKGMDKLLWNYLHDGLKIACFKHFAQQIDKKVAKEGLTAAQRERLLDEAGQYVNDTFGGQYWELLNVSPATLKWMRRAFLSPDWLVSTQRHFFANFGFGSLYDPRGFGEYLRETFRHNRHNGQTVSPEDDGDIYRQFRKREARLCYILGVCVFFYTMMNGLNALMRARDEEKEKEKAAEMRKTNPDYKSPYELAYPDGMKWYDYTMMGNTLGQQTHLFLGRYNDGTEMYVRWGKQFREFPEMFIGRKGLDFPAPMIQRMMGKANPVIGLTRDNLGALGIWGFSNSSDIEEIQAKYGKAIGVLAMNARHFLPFSVPTQAEKEFKLIDLVMPSQKGFTRYKTVDFFKDFIKAGDMEGVARVYRAATMNGIDAEKCLQAAITTLKAEQREEMRDGIVDVATASEAYDKASTLTAKKTIRNKMIKLLAAENYKAFTRAEALQIVEDYQKGDDVAEKDSDRYIEHSTSADVREDYRLSAIGKQAKKYVSQIKEAQSDGDKVKAKQLARRYGAWLAINGIVNRERTAVGKLKKQLGKGNDEKVMAEIRKLRRDAQREIDKVEAVK